MPTSSERCIYDGRWQTTTCYILVYVDDMLIAAPNRKIMANSKAKIHSKFSITDNGPLSFWLNMHFIRHRTTKTISIHQEPKIAKLLNDQRYTPEDRHKLTKLCKIPALPDKMLSKTMCPTTDVEKKRREQYPYKSILGQVLYIAITARPDIATVVSSCRYSQNPGQKHWDALLQIVQYLNGTRKLRLV